MQESQPIDFEPGLEHLARIGVALDTRDQFPDVEGVRGEVHHLIEDARYELQEWLAEFIRDLERKRSETWGTDFTEVRRLIVRMAEHGILGPGVLGEGDWLRVNLPSAMSLDAARKMDGLTLLLDVLRDIHSRLSDRAFLVDPAAFRYLIYGNLIALHFAVLASSEHGAAE